MKTGTTNRIAGAVLIALLVLALGPQVDATVQADSNLKLDHSKASRLPSSLYFHLGGDFVVNKLSSSLYSNLGLDQNFGIGLGLRLKCGFRNIFEVEYRPVQSSSSRLSVDAYGEQIEVPMNMTFKGTLVGKFNILFPMNDVHKGRYRGLYPYYGVIQAATHTDDIDEGFTSGSGTVMGLEFMAVEKQVSFGFFVERCTLEFDEMVLDGITIRGGVSEASFWRIGMSAAFGVAL